MSEVSVNCSGESEKYVLQVKSKPLHEQSVAEVCSIFLPSINLAKHANIFKVCNGIENGAIRACDRHFWTVTRA